MNHKESVIETFKKYKKEDIIITDHAKEQAVFRGLNLSEIKNNLNHPQRLVFAGKLDAEKENEEKYDCYFAYSNTQCHRYIIVFSLKCIVCTVIKINRRWQRIVEKYSKK